MNLDYELWRQQKLEDEAAKEREQDILLGEIDQDLDRFFGQIED